MKKYFILALILTALKTFAGNAQPQSASIDSVIIMTFFGENTSLKRNKSMSVYQYNHLNELIQADYYQWLENIRKWNHRSRSKINYYPKEIVEKQFIMQNDIEIKGYTRKFKLDSLSNIIEITKEVTSGAEILLMERNTFKYKMDTLVHTSKEFRSTTFFKQSETEITYERDNIIYKISSYVETEPGRINTSQQKIKFNKSQITERRIISSDASIPDTLIKYTYNNKGQLLSDTTKIVPNRIYKSPYSVSTSLMKYDEKGNLKEYYTFKLNKDGQLDKQLTNEVVTYPRSARMFPARTKFPNNPKLEHFFY